MSKKKEENKAKKASEIEKDVFKGVEETVKDNAEKLPEDIDFSVDSKAIEDAQKPDPNFQKLEEDLKDNALKENQDNEESEKADETIDNDNGGDSVSIGDPNLGPGDDAQEIVFLSKEELDEIEDRNHLIAIAHNLGFGFEPKTSIEKMRESILDQQNKIIANIEINVKSDLVSRVKDIRLSIDRTYQLANTMFNSSGSLIQSILFAKAWLGKLLAQLGTENPYAGEDKIKTAADIKPTADVANIPEALHNFSLLSRLDRVIALRDLLSSEIEVLETSVFSFSAEDVKNMRLASIAKTQCYVHLCEARFELGYELARMKNE